MTAYEVAERSHTSKIHCCDDPATYIREKEEDDEGEKEEEVEKEEEEEREQEEEEK